MEIEVKQIESLLAEKKYDQVHIIINDVVNSAISKEDEGAYLTKLFELYLDISNSINSTYLDALEEAVVGMKHIDMAENKMIDKIKLAQIRNKLNSNL